jgi:hypothetical protein
MKTITLFIATFLISISVFSQKITRHDLFGRWFKICKPGFNCKSDSSYFIMDVGFTDIDFVTSIETYPITGTYTLDTTAVQTKIVINAIQNGAKVKMQSSLIRVNQDTLEMNLFNRSLTFVKQKSPRIR